MTTCKKDCGNVNDTYQYHDQNDGGLALLTTYRDDDAGNLERKSEDYTADGTTGRNVVTEYTYDATGNLLTERTTADGLVTQHSYTYDANGKLASQTDANGQIGATKENVR